MSTLIFVESLGAAAAVAPAGTVAMEPTAVGVCETALVAAFACAVPIATATASAVIGAPYRSARFRAPPDIRARGLWVFPMRFFSFR
jgi:hypothetical protein